MCDGRTIVTGKPRSRYAPTSRSSHAILSREYCQKGLRSGVDSVIGNRCGGFWYAEAELMYTYCPQRPSNWARSARTCSGTKARNSATTSNSASPIAARTAPASRTSAVTSRTPSGSGRRADPRLRTVTSWPRAMERRTLAELIVPVPPMYRTRFAFMMPSCRMLRARARRVCAGVK